MDKFYLLDKELDGHVSFIPQHKSYRRAVSAVLLDGKMIGWAVDVYGGLLEDAKSYGVTYEYIPGKDGDSEAQYKGVWLHERHFGTLSGLIEYYTANKSLLDDIFTNAK